MLLHKLQHKNLFRFLDRLLVVHGYWCFKRIALMGTCPNRAIAPPFHWLRTYLRSGARTPVAPASRGSDSCRGRGGLCSSPSLLPHTVAVELPGGAPQLSLAALTRTPPPPPTTEPPLPQQGVQPSRLLGQQSDHRTSEQGARPPQQGSQQESQPKKALRRKWSHMEDLALLNAMVEMVHIGVYRGDNGFKPGYLTHLEEALKTFCPASKIKASPHIESCIKTLKRDWFIVNDMIHGVNHSSSGFGFNSTSNMVVVENDVWDDYLAKYQDAKQWHSKSFIHYEKCCIIFGNDRVTEEDAFDVVDAVEELGGNNESNNENGSDPIALEDVEFTQETSRSQSELSKASNDISAAINANRDMRHLVVAAMEKVLEISEVDKTMYNAKIMERRELM
ncbi:hypothetical protein Sjap_015189 [Stephania japonica]|uniref:Myb/SANT-like domain-containing protein n=1 Tax=Stephania japonica TaxID=461633 RepID=A0AAP0NQL3_9MAGN